MSDFPRLAIGACQPSAETRLLAWTLAHHFTRRGAQVQLFRGDARIDCSAAERVAAGVATWQLDSWVMSPTNCRQLFALGCRGRDLAIVEGQYGATSETPSDLGLLSDWLELPRLLVLDARRLCGCGLPARPARLDGVLLDGVADAPSFCRIAANVQALWGVPVLGGLELLPDARARMRVSAPGSAPWREALAALTTSLEHLTDGARLRRLAERPSMAPLTTSHEDETQPLDVERLPPLRMAVAYDEAFGGYCQDLLELFEQGGAVVRDFSPLRDEHLPDDCDLVYLGCGHPDEYAPALARNACLMLALRNHVRAGRRVLAEGGGLAYACTQLQDSRGHQHALAGLIPATARACPPSTPRPLESQLVRDCWLAPSGTWLRGYVSDRWQFEPAYEAHGLLRTPGEECVLLRSHAVIGSRFQLHYAARPDLLRAFFAPHHGAATVPLGAS